MNGRAACALLAVLAATPAGAGPPYVTDDPDPTDRGHWEIYAFGAGARAAGALGGEAGADLNYGAADELQLTMVLPAAYAQGAQTRIGAGTVELAAKYRVVDMERSGAPLNVAIFPRVFLPSAAAGLGSQRAQLLLPVWVGRTFGAWSAFGGGGYQLNHGEGGRDFWTGGGALTCALSERVTLGAELYARTPDAVGGRSLLATNLGVTVALHPHWSLLAAAGPGLAHAASEGQYAFYIALKADY